MSEGRRAVVLPSADVPREYSEVSGDHSPLHVDDAAAAEAGLPGVILHGMYLFALAARAACGDDDDPRRTLAVSAQFRIPAVPGEEIEVEVGEDVVGAGGVRRQVHVRQRGAELLRDAEVTLQEASNRPR